MKCLFGIPIKPSTLNMSGVLRMLLIGLCVYTPLTQAAPMGFQDSWMMMGDLGPNWRETFINYALTPKDAIGVSATYMRSDDKRVSQDLVDVTYTRLLQRWNMREAQANLWFIGGIGVVKPTQGFNQFPSQIPTQNQYINQENDGSKVMISPGVQFDYETTRVYFSVNQRLYRAKDINNDYSSARAGFSLYETEYDETQPWLILEARRMHALSDQTEITPMLRLINKNYFIEAGVNTSRQARFNFMYIF